MIDFYILDGRTAKPVDLMAWATWYEGSRDARVVKQEDVGDRWISTVFVGINQAFDDGPPLLFETMVFQPDRNMGELYCERCSTYDEAEAMHEKAKAWVLAGEPDL